MIHQRVGCFEGSKVRGVTFQRSDSFVSLKLATLLIHFQSNKGSVLIIHFLLNQALLTLCNSSRRKGSPPLNYCSLTLMPAVLRMIPLKLESSLKICCGSNQHKLMILNFSNSLEFFQIIDYLKGRTGLTFHLYHFYIKIE